MREQSTEEQLRFLSAIVGQANVGIIASDRERRIRVWNRAAEELLGIASEDALGRSMDDFERLLPSRSQEVRSDMKDVLASGATWEGEIDLRSATGRPFTALVRNGPLLDVEGSVIGYAGLIIDVSKRKRSEVEANRRARQQAAVSALGRRALSGADVSDLLEEAVRVVADTLDVELAKVLELNERGDAFAIRAGVGWEPGVVGKETVPASDSHAALTLAEGSVIVADYGAETRFRPRDLLLRHGARSGVTAVIEGNERAYGVIGAHSKSQRSFSEDDAHFLQAIGNVLAAALSRQRAERLELQLQQAQRLEAVGQLAGGIAHDFNNLLSVVLNYAQFLGREAEDESTRSDLREIEEAAKRAAELTRQLLTFSRRDIAEAVEIDVAAVVRESTDFLRRTIGENIALAVDVADDASLPVSLAPGQADQILMNLVVNARDAIGGIGKIAVEARRASDADLRSDEPLAPAAEYVLLSVADDGKGMSPEVAAQAFEPFFSTKPKDKGTGLGLATVYGIAHQAGGHVRIDSEEGRGTAISVLLPLADASERSEAELPAQSPTGRGETILVVEDEAAVRRMTCRVLEQNGYEVLAAGNGADALKLYEEAGEGIELVLTDVVMPVLSGKDLIDALRSRGSTTKAIYMSGYAGDIVSAQELGDGVSLLQKPFTASSLLAAVRQMLEAA